MLCLSVRHDAFEVSKVCSEVCHMIEVDSSSTLVGIVGEIGMTVAKAVEVADVTCLALVISHVRQVCMSAPMFSMAIATSLSDITESGAESNLKLPNLSSPATRCA